ncbi:hypothetical protein Tco_0140702 [Tanacetum coccineum]
MDPVIRCTTLPSYSRSLKGFLFHFSRRSIQFYRLSHSELVDIEKVAVRSSLRPLKTKNALLIKILRVLRIILVVLPEHPSDTKVLTMKMEILLEPTSNKLLEILLKMNLPDHRSVLTDPEDQAKMEMETPRSSGVVERETEETTDKEQSNFQGSTAHIPPPVNPIPILEPDVSKTLPKPNIPYPSRRNDQKSRDKASNQMEKIFQIFQDLRFDISFADALTLMPRFAPTIKSLLMNKEKLLELAKIPLNENCSAMLLKKLSEKLRDPGKFLIPSDFPGMDEILFEDLLTFILGILFLEISTLRISSPFVKVDVVALLYTFDARLHDDVSIVSCNKDGDELRLEL